MYRMNMADLFIYYLTEHAAKKKSFADDKSIINKYLIPHFKNKDPRAVKYLDVQELHSAMVDKPYMANRVLSTLSVVLNLAERFELRDAGSNPCKHVKRYQELNRRRYLSEPETINFMAAIERLDDRFLCFKFFILMLYYTGARSSEIMNARWDQIKGQQLNLEESKTGRRVVYLNAYAVQILTCLRAYYEGDFYSFPENLFFKKFDPRYLWATLCSNAQLKDFHIHDLRHNFASAGISTGLTLPQIGELLGHSSPATTARYAHLCSAHAVDATEKIGEQLQTVNNLRFPSPESFKDMLSNLG